MSQIAERILEAAKKVAQAEATYKAAREEYDLLVKQAISGTARRSPRRAKVQVPVGPSTPTAQVSAGLGHLGIVDQVFLAMQRHGNAVDAQTIADETRIAPNTVRWAFVELGKQSRIRRVERGMYEAVVVDAAAVN